MNNITIKNAYTNAKQTAIAFWAQNAGKGKLTAEEELCIVKYKAMLMTDIVTLNKQQRYDEAEKLQGKIKSMRLQLVNGVFDFTVELEKYEASRSSLTCIKRQRKTDYQKLCECLDSIALDNDKIRELVEKYISEHKA